MRKNNVITLKINDETVVHGDAEKFIDTFTSELVKKNNRAIMKRNIVLDTIAFGYKVVIIFVAIKYFPELFTILFGR